MKKNILNIIGIILLVNILFSLGSCIETEDLVTADAQTGGLIEAVNANIPFKLGETTSVDIDVSVPIGPAITSVEVYKTFYTVDGDGSNTELAGTISVAGQNVSGILEDGLNFTYNQLREGLTVGGAPLPTDENLLDIGDSWVFTFESVLDDGRTVVNNATTNVSVANFFAGSYVSNVYYLHPTAGVQLDHVDIDKELVATNANTCKTNISGWSDAFMFITIYDDNSVTVVEDADTWGDAFHNIAWGTNAYDPATGKIDLYYGYTRSSGARMFEEHFTPAAK